MCRQQFVKTVTQYTVDGEDASVLKNSAIRAMFTAEENNELLSRIRTELIQNLDDARRNWQFNRDSDEDPESYIEPFMELLSAVKRELDSDTNLRDAIDRQKILVREWIADEQCLEEIPDEDKSQEPEFEPAEYPLPAEHASERSIFDDIDA